jgi:hypothetical protein
VVGEETPGCEPAIGALFADRYAIEALLGRGGMGAVYRVRDLAMAEPVAVKFLSLGAEAPPVAVLRFREEVRLARRVTHPKVARVYDIGEHRGLLRRGPHAAERDEQIAPRGETEVDVAEITAVPLRVPRYLLAALDVEDGDAHLARRCGEEDLASVLEGRDPAAPPVVPTHVGVSRSRGRPVGCRARRPHARGGEPMTAVKVCEEPESSPRTRGEPHVSPLCGSALSVVPTHVG